MAEGHELSQITAGPPPDVRPDAPAKTPDELKLDDKLREQAVARGVHELNLLEARIDEFKNRCSARKTFAQYLLYGILPITIGLFIALVTLQALGIFKLTNEVMNGLAISMLIQVIALPLAVVKFYFAADDQLTNLEGKPGKSVEK